jgi:hypothetical protein
MEFPEGRVVELETVPSEKGASIGARVRDALPLVGVVFALIANAAWIGFLGYTIFRLI